ncbi:hypothetical protein P7K49_027154 [Saguinus oedipus]|uniref:Uncharacterized protein n=1 Tax=Saguinus oedipus TaxID=9490 RepID=A0ABQ9UGP9_SAGOE|nr:hypothetical protein P7K49_027154 [Saguinus oedipus]
MKGMESRRFKVRQDLASGRAGPTEDCGHETPPPFTAAARSPPLPGPAQPLTLGPIPPLERDIPPTFSVPPRPPPALWSLALPLLTGLCHLAFALAWAVTPCCLLAPAWGTVSKEDSEAATGKGDRGHHTPMGDRLED